MWQTVDMTMEPVPRPSWIDIAGAITNSLNATGTTTIDETGKASRFFRLQATEE